MVGGFQLRVFAAELGKSRLSRWLPLALSLSLSKPLLVRPALAHKKLSGGKARAVITAVNLRRYGNSRTADQLRPHPTPAGKPAGKHALRRYARKSYTAAP